MQSRAGKSRYVVNEMLTLEDIAPSWSRRLERLPASKWSLKWMLWRSDIILRASCIVGEAHGRSSSYWDSCEECRTFSIRFHRYFEGRAYGELKRDVQGFVQHWNDKHQDLRIERSGSWLDGFLRFDGYICTYR